MELFFLLTDFRSKNFFYKIIFIEHEEFNDFKKQEIELMKQEKKLFLQNESSYKQEIK